MAQLRNAWCCSHRECIPPIRLFLSPADTCKPNCPEHGNTMIKQVNVPYERPDTSKPIGAPKVKAAQAASAKRRKR